MTQIFRGFFTKLITGLLISAPLVYRIATAELAGDGNNIPSSVSVKQLAIQAGLTAISARFQYPFEQQANTFPLLAKAALCERADLLWKQTLPLGDRDMDTIQNITIAAEAVDYAVVAPGEIFSFNEKVGVRTEEKGYRPGLMYLNGELVQGIGGGICVLSTLLYNAALECGLRIIERHPHSGPVMYALPGRDAAVSYGWADMRFKNNTEHPIVIRTIVKDDQLVVAFYGSKIDGRRIEIRSEDYEEIPYKIIEREDPSIPEGTLEVKQKARPGFSVTTVRLTYQYGKLVSKEVISRDTILPRHKIILVPPKPQVVPVTESPFLPGTETPRTETERTEKPSPVQIEVPESEPTTDTPGFKEK